MKRVIYFLTGMILILVASCVSPEEWGDKYDQNIVPESVNNVKVENINGGAIISYTLPSMKDLLGAKVTYSLTPDGELVERWASAEKDTIVLEGYGDTNERTVTVYAVHKNGNVSTGIPVTIKPLTSPISLMRETLNTAATFGGIQISWDNPLRKDMGIALYVEDSITHEMNLWDKYFSNSIYGKTTFRPFEPEKQKFRIEMFDRWQNYAEPLDISLTPLEETVIKSRGDNTIPLWSLFDDGKTNNSSSPYRFLYRCDGHTNIEPGNPGYRFEDGIDWPNTTGKPWYTTSTYNQSWYVPGADPIAVPFPFYYTFDMGKKAVYSRLKILAFQRSPVFSSDIPVEFDVWGTNNPKTIEEVECPHGIYEKGSREANQAYWSSWDIVNGTDAWKNDWVKLATFKYVTASGENRYYDGIPLSSEDISAYQQGYEFEFNMDVAEPYRYLRWEIHATSTNARVVRLMALQYWGSYSENE